MNSTSTPIWGGTPDQDISALRVAMLQLRKKLGEKPMRPQFIATVPGVGYRFHMLES